jgi:hypothetical protein
MPMELNRAREASKQIIRSQQSGLHEFTVLMVSNAESEIQASQGCNCRNLEFFDVLREKPHRSHGIWVTRLGKGN